MHHSRDVPVLRLTGVRGVRRKRGTICYLVIFLRCLRPGHFLWPWFFLFPAVFLVTFIEVPDVADQGVNIVFGTPLDPSFQQHLAVPGPDASDKESFMGLSHCVPEQLPLPQRPRAVDNMEF